MCQINRPAMEEDKVHAYASPRPLMSEDSKAEEGKKSNPSSFSEVLGLRELFCPQVWRASLAELVGTAVLVFAIDTIVISSIETKTSAPNLVLSILVAIIVTILLIAANPVSGGHINPVITFAAALVGIISFSRAAVYIFMQCVGGILGAFALKAVVNSSLEAAFSLGGCTLTVVAPGPQGPVTVGIETGQALWLEIIYTFIFLFASIWMAFDHRQARALGKVMVLSIVGIVVGILVFISTTENTVKGYTGVGMNPARCLGPAIVRGGHLWTEHWVFWVGPTIACFAFYLYVKLIPRQHFNHGEGYKYDIFDYMKSLPK
ncbi:LOW QUALITY PROTEIN: uncharacterized protein LOC126782024 [Argentina anserina]|uniref:LOW QUALITY PROTEIN: uncharacterized protein LOC126782024 n=1 Tax=Argentina anserina TaxID=57926 RepID=UPI0021766C7C|nr:LOW QUALITY PROTEIN: uncharacterized protein LOC126782024 [Potentilla anserina]